MKLDFKGIQFNVWLALFLFVSGAIGLLGVLQVAMVKPYYRYSKIKDVQGVVEQIEASLFKNDVLTSEGIQEAFNVNLDNNVCSVIYNSEGKLIYEADSLGASCVFSQRLNLNDVTFYPEKTGKYFVEILDNCGEDNYSINIESARTNPDMIIYGKKIGGNLSNYYLWVNSPLEPVESIVTFFWNQYVTIFVLVAILSFLVSLLVSSRITKPIVEMKKSADILASGDYSVTFKSSYFTETDDLADTLNDATQKLSKVAVLRKDLIANVSHDIKTPLTMIKAYAEMIRDISGDKPAKREEHLTVILKEVDYLNRLVTDMAELSKMESGNYELNYSNFDMVEVINNILMLNQFMVDERNLHVEVKMPETCTIYGDEIKLGQVVTNFITNAIKYTPDGKHIFVNLIRGDDYIRFEVKDEGEGIKEEDFDLIWNRYYKTDKTYARNAKSTGLGLAIAKAILDTHHARYGVKSEVGKGSCFYFELDQDNEV